MNKIEQEKITTRLIAYIDGQLSIQDSKETEDWIESDDAIRAQYLQLKEICVVLEGSEWSTPSDEMTKRYDQWLTGLQELPTSKIKSINYWYKVAAAILVLFIGGISAYGIHTMYIQKQELAKIKAELEATKQLVMTNLSNTQSASQRISAVYSTEDIAKPDQDILQLLIKTMNEDPNSNVRMASLEALSKYYSMPEVRSAFILSMKYQKDPVVQIALIQLLVQQKEKIILNDLQNITVQNGIIKAVKDEAYKGIFKLT